MVTDAGLQKGMKTVLEERGVTTREYEVCRSYCIKTLYYYIIHLQDFADRTTILEQEIESLGHICLYLPKFHCELNPIEHAKKYTWANAMVP